MPASSQIEVLERVARAVPLEQSLSLLCLLVERHQPGAMCSVMLIDACDGDLKLAASPSLSDEARRLLASLTPGPSAGSCGSAAYTAAPVIVTDTHVAPQWASLRHLADQMGIRACWSIPFRDRAGKVAGTFAISLPSPTRPSDEILRVLEIASLLASVAVEQASNERAAARENALREAVIRTAGEGICACMAIDRPPYVQFLVWNDRMTAITGYTIDEINERGWYQSVYPDPEIQARAVERMERMRKGDPLRGEEWEITRKDGQTRVVTISTSEAAMIDGPPAVVAIMQDITDQRRLQAQYFHTQKLELLGRLAGGVAHDFNNLLTALMGNAQIAAECIDSPDEVSHALNEILSVADRAARLTHQLLAFARREVVAPEVLDLSEQLKTSQRLLNRLLGEDVQLVLDVDPHLGHVRMDRGQFGQIIVNIAVNARDAMPRGGTLTITARNTTIAEASAQANAPAPGEYVQLTFADQGTGMSPEVVRHIFEPFFTTKPEGRGSGLGLSTVHGIVSQAGGSILVETRLGGGTTFRIYLPTTSEPIGRERESALPHHASAAARVLVVEDDESVRSIITSILTRAGYGVTEADNGATALERLSDPGAAFQLVVTDLVMPRMSGSELVATLVRRGGSPPILVVSGYSDDTVAEHGLSLNALEFLRKPFAPAELLHRVRDLIERAPTVH